MQEKRYVSYYMEGVDSSPHVVPLSELEKITYTNLDAGKYVFHISILDSSKRQSQELGCFSLVKEEEMYQKWWFKVYAVIVAGLAIAWVS